MISSLTSGCRTTACSRLLAICFFVPLLLQAQKPAASGMIAGTVSGPDGSPLANAQVILRANLGSGKQIQTMTDPAGVFQFSALPFGVYKLTASTPGYACPETKIVILASASTKADLVLTKTEINDENRNQGKARQQTSSEFSAAGARGSIAPSGYATGLSSEEAAQIVSGANALDTAIDSPFNGQAPADCKQEPVLIRNVESSPQDDSANRALGDFYLSRGEYSKSIPYLRAAHAIAPDELSAVRDLALALIGNKRVNDAVALLEEWIPDHRSDSAFLRLLALAYRSAGKRDQSITALQHAAISDPGDENQYQCGIELIQLGATQQALDLFTAAEQKHPESARLWLGMGITWQLLDDRQRSVNALLRSSDADPDFLPPLAVLAELYSLPDSIEADLRRRIADYLVAHPSDAEAHFTDALVLSKEPHGDTDLTLQQEIASQLNRALQLNPKIARAHFLLGDNQAEANNLPAAIDEYVSGLILEPGNAQAHYRLSQLYHKNGQQDAAHKEMETFRALHEKSAEESFADPSRAVTQVLSSSQPLAVPQSCKGKTE